MEEYEDDDYSDDLDDLEESARDMDKIEDFPDGDPLDLGDRKDWLFTNTED